MKKFPKFNSILIALLIYNNLISQTIWEYHNFQEQNWSKMINVYELPNRDILSLNSIYQLPITEYKNQDFSILRIHDKNTGEVKKEADYKNDSISTSLELIFYNKEKEIFIICGNAHKMVNSNVKKSYFISTVWDKNLNLLNDTIINLNPKNIDHDLWYINGITLKNGDYIVLGNYSPKICQYTTNNKILFVRINELGQIINDNYYYENPDINHPAIIENNDDFILPGKETLIFNKEFDLIDSITTTYSNKYLFNFNYNAFLLDENKILISARANGDNGLAIFNKDINLIKFHGLDYENKNAPYPFMVKSFDWSDTSEIFFGSQSIQRYYFVLSKVNSNLEPYWIKFYEFKNNNGICLYSLIATNDGGFIITGGFGTIEDDYYLKNYHSWAMKLDGNGYTTKTFIEKPACEITLFPNPTNGIIKLVIDGPTDKTKLLLYDMKGNLCKELENFNNKENQLDLSDLKAGIYAWHLIKDEKVIGMGKCVKD